MSLSHLQGTLSKAWQPVPAVPAPRHLPSNPRGLCCTLPRYSHRTPPGPNQLVARTINSSVSPGGCECVAEHQCTKWLCHGNSRREPSEVSSLARWGLHWQIAETLGAEVNLHNYLQCTVSFLFTQAKLNSFWSSHGCLSTSPIRVTLWVHIPKSKAPSISSPTPSQILKICRY